MTVSDRGSPLRRARVARGWTLREAAARVRARCPGPTDPDIGCRVNADRLHQYETGLLHPGPGHAQVLASLYRQTAAELGLTTWTGQPAPPDTTPPDDSHGPSAG